MKNGESALIRAGRVFLLFFNISFAVMALYFIFKGGVRVLPDQSLEYKDFISILLTGLSVMIAIGAIFLAVLAIWSYAHFKQLTVEAAEKAASDVAGDKVTAWLSAEAPHIIRKHVDMIKDTSLGRDDDEGAADAIGEQA